MDDIIKRSENVNEEFDLMVNGLRDIQHIKIPFNDIAALGSSFAPLVSSFKQNEQMFSGGGIQSFATKRDSRCVSTGKRWKWFSWVCYGG